MSLKKKRVAIPAQVRRSLLIECGFKCSMNRCERAISLEVHHMDSDPSNNKPDNLIVFCSVHHHQADRGVIDHIACKFLKNSLKEINSLTGKPKELKTRNAFFNNTKKSLLSSTELRATLVGPTFIRPDFLIEIRNKTKATIDLDFHFFSFVKNNFSRIIFRNNARFKEKISEYLPGLDEQKLYKREMLRLIENIEHNKEFSNFSFCCVDSGFYKIDFIFDSCLITSSRISSSKPINTALLYNNLEEIQRSKVNFDNIFDNCFRGRKIEFESLKTYISTLFE